MTPLRGKKKKKLLLFPLSVLSLIFPSARNTAGGSNRYVCIDEETKSFLRFIYEKVFAVRDLYCCHSTHFIHA